MIKTEPIIAVDNVEKSSEFYQKLLGCVSNHGGSVFEILADKSGEQILSLHKWGEHEHPTFTDPKNAGNGLILYFLVDNIEPIWDNAKKLNARIENEPKLNPNSGRMEFSIRDLDNYYVSVCSEKN
ncbi:Glyoxalase/Bleomycin resistance protein/Dioxygenase superfamily protein [Zobellia uliginosa]|uniref:Glyoxalase/Bleomycin resistance protein/Dioxygenase superfamily protein n=1 Tax=Zobellia uliginosa TaxID=143224 RepID=A0ABY1KZJ9_9FLAO|nr:VOC family protein [Zobellia uliginosa]SIS97806.1 Glyoxalase/Bleomycin resistance protein/Dioxygenase superfamily protein [Zobellia uliginosa]